MVVESTQTIVQSTAPRRRNTAAHGAETVPGAVGGFVPETFVDRLPRPITFEQVTPRSPGGQLPQDPVDDLAPVPPRDGGAAASLDGTVPEPGPGDVMPDFPRLVACWGQLSSAAVGVRRPPGRLDAAWDRGPREAAPAIGASRCQVRALTRTGDSGGLLTGTVRHGLEGGDGREALRIALLPEGLLVAGEVPQRLSWLAGPAKRRASFPVLLRLFSRRGWEP